MAFTPSTVRQSAFRGRFDDGNETTATWKAATNTNHRQLRGQIFRMRFELETTVVSTAFGINARCQFSRNGGAFTDVAAQGSSAQPVRYADGVNLADDVQTTQQIGSGSFLAGRYDENGSTTAFFPSNVVGGKTEAEFALEIVTANVNVGDTIQLRLTNAGTALNGGYLNTPTLTVADIPSVISCSPNSGTTAGGTSVTITGTNFINVSSVTFGGAAATGVTVVNSTTITCTTPAHAAGQVSVQVNTEVGFGNALAYTYVNPTVSGSGTLASQAATASGSGTSRSTGTGALTAQAATVSGSGTVTWVGTGTLASQDSTIAGAGTVEWVATGALTAQAAQAAGVGISESLGSGALQAADSIINGTGIVLADGSGTLVAQDSTIAGSGITGSTGSGTLAAQASTIEGQDSITGTGALLAGGADVDGVGISESLGSGALVAEASIIVGAGGGLILGSGALAADAVMVAGVGTVRNPPRPDGRGKWFKVWSPSVREYDLRR